MSDRTGSKLQTSVGTGLRRTAVAGAVLVLATGRMAGASVPAADGTTSPDLLCGGRTTGAATGWYYMDIIAQPDGDLIRHASP